MLSSPPRYEIEIQNGDKKKKWGSGLVKTKLKFSPVEWNNARDTWKQTKKIKIHLKLGVFTYSKIFERKWGRQCVLSDLSSSDEFIKKQI